MTRINVLMQYMQKEAGTGRELPPEGIQRLMERLEGLLKGYETVDMNGARKLRKEIGNFFSQQQQPQQAQPSEEELIAMEQQQAQMQ